MSDGREPLRSTARFRSVVTSSSVGFAASIGGLGGGSLAAHRGARSAAGAALVGAVGLGTSEAVARARQKEGEIPALWQRIAVSAALAAPLGWVAEKLTSAGPRAVGAGTGAVVGAMGLRPQKVAMGPLGGAAVGQALSGGPAPGGGGGSPRGPGGGGGGGERPRLGLSRHICPALPGPGGQPAGRPGQRRAPAV